MKKTKRNPQDATLRNIRALKKRLAVLERKFSLLGGLQFSNSRETLDQFFARR